MNTCYQNAPTLDQIKMELARREYASYISYVHEGKYKKTLHNDFICNLLQNAIEKRKRMLDGLEEMKVQYIAINMPPRHGKSMTITETYPSYFLGHFPHDRVIELSYGTNFAERFGKKNREKIEQYGKQLFNVELNKRSMSSTDWDIQGTRGGMISRGILAGVTGQGSDLMLIDDPIKNREEANSETYREKLWNEWIDSLSTRLHPAAICILILTRWHNNDLQGRLLDPEYAKPLPWQVYNFPIEAEENDILGREIGEPLWPERYGKSYIEERKRYPSSFNALYQGRPTAQEGNLIKRHWFQYYDVLPKLDTKILSVDAAFKDEKTSDYVCIQVWGKAQADMYLIDNLRARLSFPATLQAIRNITKKHPDCGAKLIEDKANGTAIIAMLRKEIGGIIAVNPLGGKVARVNAVSPFIESGNVYLPRNAEWLHDFIEECASFPLGKFDDQTDCMSQAMNRLISKERTPIKPSYNAFDELGKANAWEHYD